jgi:hypothetical protein
VLLTKWLTIRSEPVILADKPGPIEGTRWIGLEHNECLPATLYFRAVVSAGMHLAGFHGVGNE